MDVYQGAARFVGPNQVEVDGTQLEFDRAIIATGSRPAKSDSPGLDEVGYQTSDSIFSLPNLPRSLVVIGGGSVACELAQAFRRFGSEVHLLTDNDGILPVEDRQATAIVEAQFKREGIRIHTGAVVVAARKTGRSKSVVVEQQGRKLELIADEILVALGREPNVNELGLEAAGVRFSAAGIEVDDRLQTSNRAIFAAADVCASFPITNDSQAMARVCVHNALFFGRKRLTQLHNPRCTYTDPELAHVGLTRAKPTARASNWTATVSSWVTASAADGDGNSQGFVVLHTRRGRSRVVGATIVACAGRRDDRPDQPADVATLADFGAERHDSLPPDGERSLRACRRSIPAPPTHAAGQACARPVVYLASPTAARSGSAAGHGRQVLRSDAWALCITSCC